MAAGTTQMQSHFTGKHGCPPGKQPRRGQFATWHFSLSIFLSESPERFIIYDCERGLVPLSQHVAGTRPRSAEESSSGSSPWGAVWGQNVTCLKKTSSQIDKNIQSICLCVNFLIFIFPEALILVLSGTLSMLLVSETIWLLQETLWQLLSETLNRVLQVRLGLSHVGPTICSRADWRVLCVLYVCIYRPPSLFNLSSVLRRWTGNGVPTPFNQNVETSDRLDKESCLQHWLRQTTGIMISPFGLILLTGLS